MYSHRPNNPEGGGSLKLSCNCMWAARAHTIWFSERIVIGSQSPGQCFVGFYFLLELKNSLIADHSPQVNHELSCWHNYEEEEGGQAAQEKYLGEEFCHSEGWRYRWEDQGGKMQKDEEGSGWLFGTHCVLTHPFSLFVVYDCILPTDGELLLRSPHKLP